MSNVTKRQFLNTLKPIEKIGPIMLLPRESVSKNKKEGDRVIKKGLWLGTATGLILGVLLWFVEAVTGEKVYTLLLNIDFIPLLGDIEWPAWMEWGFHLFLSWVIAIGYLAWVRFKTEGETSARWATSLLLSVMAALTYFPLTDLAIKDTPSMDDVSAITYWFFAHSIYAGSLVILDQWSE